eukprot:350385_1
MDDFLGTSIQYSEQQILLLEQQHAAERKQMVEELIQSGYLDSDYESIESDSELSVSESESEYNESEYNELEFVENLQIDTLKCQTINSNNTSKVIPQLLEITLTDLKSLIIFFLLMISVPYILRESNDDNISSVYYKYTNECKYTHETLIYQKPNVFNEDNDTQNEFNQQLIVNKIYVSCSDKYTMLPLKFSIGTRIKSQKKYDRIKDILCDSSQVKLLKIFGLMPLIMSFIGITAFTITSE